MLVIIGSDFFKVDKEDKADENTLDTHGEKPTLLRKRKATLRLHKIRLKASSQRLTVPLKRVPKR